MPFPAHRYARLRYFNRVPKDRIFREMVDLRIPGIQAPEDLEPVLRGAKQRTDRQHLHVAVDNTATKAKKKSSVKVEDPLSRILDAPDEELTEPEYARRYGLRDYDSKAGEAKLRNAIRMWMNPQARELLCVLLTRRVPTKEIREAVNGQVPGLQKGGIRLTDIDTFERLFWDFSGMPMEEVTKFLSSNAYCTMSYTALAEGLDAVLWRMGLAELDVGEMDMIREARNVAYLKIRRARQMPWSLTSQELQRYYGIMSSTFDDERKARIAVAANEIAGGKDRVIGTQQMLSQEDFKAEYALRLKKERALPSYADILDRAESRQRMDEIDLAYRDGALTDEQAAELKERVESGEDIGLEAREMVRAYGEEHSPHSELLDPQSRLGPEDEEYAEPEREQA